MNKYYILLFVLLFVPFVSALDKPLAKVYNCYNVSISLEQNDGAPVGVDFKDCSNRGNGLYECACNLDSKVFAVVMVSDGAVIRDVRNYDVSISANVFRFTKKSTVLNVDDWGDYIEVLGDTSKLNNSDLLEPEVKIIIRNITKEVPVYINRTVYIQNITYINREIEVNKTIEHNNTVYVNTTCEKDVSEVCMSLNDFKNNCSDVSKIEKEIENKNSIIAILIIFALALIFSIGVLVYLIIKGD